MIIDGNLDFADQQSLTGTADVASTNIFDAGVAKKLFGGGGGAGPKVLVTLSASGGTTPTIRARLVGADNTALTSNPIILADSGVSRVLVAADVPWVVELVPSEQMDAKRYYGVMFTQSGTNPTATVNANLVINAQSNFTGIGP